jgi:large subunit ribosomal protein L15
MTKLNDLPRPEGAHRAAKRVGRGPGSGLGKTSGRGHKGHKARTGGSTHPWFEGGQMPLQRRLPKRGFKNPFRTEYEIVNLRDLERIAEDTITPDLLHASRLIDLGKGRKVKILAEGTIQRAITVRAHAVSASARSKIEAAGGTVELLES